MPRSDPPTPSVVPALPRESAGSSSGRGSTTAVARAKVQGSSRRGSARQPERHAGACGAQRAREPSCAPIPAMQMEKQGARAQRRREASCARNKHERAFGLTNTAFLPGRTLAVEAARKRTEGPRARPAFMRRRPAREAPGLTGGVSAPLSKPHLASAGKARRRFRMRCTARRAHAPREED